MPDGMHGYRVHPYIVQDAALFFALVPIVLLFTMMIGARFFENIRRARKPTPSRPPAIIALASTRRLLATPD